MMLLREVQTKLQPVTADADLFWCRELHVRTQYSRSGDGSGSESHPLVGFRTQSRSGDGSGSESHPLVNSMSVRSHGLGMGPYAVTVWGWVRERVAPSRGYSRSGDGSGSESHPLVGFRYHQPLNFLKLRLPTSVGARRIFF